MGRKLVEQRKHRIKQAVHDLAHVPRCVGCRRETDMAELIGLDRAAVCWRKAVDAERFKDRHDHVVIDMHGGGIEIQTAVGCQRDRDEDQREQQREVGRVVQIHLFLHFDLVGEDHFQQRADRAEQHRKNIFEIIKTADVPFEIQLVVFQHLAPVTVQVAAVAAAVELGNDAVIFSAAVPFCKQRRHLFRPEAEAGPCQKGLDGIRLSAVDIEVERAADGKHIQNLGKRASKGGTSARKQCDSLDDVNTIAMQALIIGNVIVVGQHARDLIRKRGHGRENHCKNLVDRFVVKQKLCKKAHQQVIHRDRAVAVIVFGFNAEGVRQNLGDHGYRLGRSQIAVNMRNQGFDGFVINNVIIRVAARITQNIVFPRFAFGVITGAVVVISDPFKRREVRFAERVDGALHIIEHGIADRTALLIVRERNGTVAPNAFRLRVHVVRAPCRAVKLIKEGFVQPFDRGAHAVAVAGVHCNLFRRCAAIQGGKLLVKEFARKGCQLRGQLVGNGVDIAVLREIRSGIGINRGFGCGFILRDLPFHLREHGIAFVKLRSAFGFFQTADQRRGCDSFHGQSEDAVSIGSKQAVGFISGFNLFALGDLVGDPRAGAICRCREIIRVQRTGHPIAIALGVVVVTVAFGQLRRNLAELGRRLLQFSDCQMAM